MFIAPQLERQLWVLSCAHSYTCRVTPPRRSFASFARGTNTWGFRLLLARQGRPCILKLAMGILVDLVSQKRERVADLCPAFCRMNFEGRPADPRARHRGVGFSLFDTEERFYTVESRDRG